MSWMKISVSNIIDDGNTVAMRWGSPSPLPPVFMVEQQYPFLSQVYEQYLTIPVTSVPCDAAGLVVVHYQLHFCAC